MGINTDRPVRRLVIEEEFGIYHIGPGGRGTGVTGSSMEKALGKAAPHFSEDKVEYAAELLEDLLSPRGPRDGYTT